MSRSVRHVPIIGNCGRNRSDVLFKKCANRALRRAVRSALHTNVHVEVLPMLREVSDVYDSSKDGKQYFPFAQFEVHYDKFSMVYRYSKMREWYRIIGK